MVTGLKPSRVTAVKIAMNHTRKQTKLYQMVSCTQVTMFQEFVCKAVCREAKWQRSRTQCSRENKVPGI